MIDALRVIISIFCLQVLVRNPDGSPAPGEVISVSATNYNSRYDWKKNFTSDENGIVNYVLTEITPENGNLNIRVSNSRIFLNHEKGPIFGVEYLFLFTIDIFTGPPCAVGNLSGCRCVSDYRSGGLEFDPGPVAYFCGD